MDDDDDDDPGGRTCSLASQQEDMASPFETVLLLLLLQGNLRFLKLLLSRRANWLQKDLEEMTPLHLATRHPSPKALALLLKHIGPGEVDTQDKNKVEGAGEWLTVTLSWV